jgi:hypothetical protein
MEDLTLMELEAIEFAMWHAIDQARFSPERHDLYRSTWKKVKDQIACLKGE